MSGLQRPCAWCGQDGGGLWWAKVPGAGARGAPADLCDPCHERWLAGEPAARGTVEDWHQCSGGEFVRGESCPTCRRAERGRELGVVGRPWDGGDGTFAWREPGKADK